MTPPPEPADVSAEDERAPGAADPSEGGGERASFRAGLRLGAYAALAVGEITLFFSRFDTVALGEDPSGWRRFASQAYVLSYLLLAVLTALAVFGRALWPSLRGNSLSRVRDDVRGHVFLVGHLIAFGGLWASSAYLFDSPLPEHVSVGGWLLVWGACGLASVVLWMLGLFRAATLERLYRRVARPLWFAVGVGVAAWVAGLLTPRLWDLWKPLSRATLWVAYGLLRPFTDVIEVYPDEMFIGSSEFMVQVVAFCSGYQGIGLIWVFMGAYLWFFRNDLRFPRAWLILIFSTVLVWCANAVRIAALVAIGTWIDGDIASGGFHSKAGWVMFCAVALGTVALTRRMDYFTRRESTHAQPGASRPTAAYLLPLLVLIAVTMVTGAVAVGLDAWYGLRVVLAGAVLLAFRREYGSALRPRGPAVAILAGAAVAAGWLLLMPAYDETAVTAMLDEHLAGLSALAAGAWWMARTIGFVIVVPIVEELAFRGYLTRRLIAYDFTEVPPGSFTWTSFLVSSVLFGVLHQALIAGTMAGMLFAWAYYRRSSLGDAIVAHAAANGLLALYAVTTGHWSAWI